MNFRQEIVGEALTVYKTHISATAVKVGRLPSRGHYSSLFFSSSSFKIFLFISKIHSVRHDNRASKGSVSRSPTVTHMLVIAVIKIISRLT